MDKHPLDRKDRLILSAFCDNARSSYNQIAKKTHISKDSVRSRILRMEKEGYLISYFTLINYSKLGIGLYNVYCRLKSINHVTKPHITSLISNPHISSITWLMGKYDLELQIMAKSKKEIRTIIANSNFLDKIEEYKITLAGKPKLYSTNNLSTSFISDKDKNENIEVLDNLDLDLLMKLSTNARMRIIDLAEELCLDESQIRARIKSMIKKEIILGFYARTNGSFSPRTRYLTLIKIKRDLTNSEIESLKKMKNLFYLKSCKGDWNYVVRLHVGSDKELVETFYNLRSILSKNLLDFKVHTILQILKFDPSPKRLLVKD